MQVEYRCRYCDERFDVTVYVTTLLRYLPTVETTLDIDNGDLQRIHEHVEEVHGDKLTEEVGRAARIFEVPAEMLVDDRRK